jgi:hypothetical protein
LVDALLARLVNRFSKTYLGPDVFNTLRPVQRAPELDEQLVELADTYLTDALRKRNCALTYEGLTDLATKFVLNFLRAVGNYKYPTYAAVLPWNLRQEDFDYLVWKSRHYVDRLLLEEFIKHL